MSRFDDIYGPGALDSLREAADWAPDWPLLRLTDEFGAQLRFSWDGPSHGGPWELAHNEFGKALIVYEPKVWSWAVLVAADTGSLWYSRMVHITQWAIDHGVEELHAAYDTPTAKEILLRGGFEEDEDGVLRAPAQRIADYGWWKLGREGYSEPDWHRRFGERT